MTDAGTTDAAAPPTASADADADANADADADADADAHADAGVPDSDGDGTPDLEDCAPNDPTRWQLLAYAYRDADGDSYTVSQSGSICSGATLPAGYANAANGADCDDTNPSIYVLASVYADADGDGVGAGRECRRATCTPTDR